MEAYTFNLATAKEVTAWGKTRMTRRDDPRVHRFAEHLAELPKPDAVVFEDVQFSSYTLQTQLWASLRTAVWLTFGKSCLLECVPVTTLKLFATGCGNADKKMMESTLFRLHPEWKSASLDDNAIDAVWIFRWATTNLARAKI